MADVSKITLPGGNTYNIKDAAARLMGAGSGTIVLFDDGAEDKPISELRIGINPVQSGSGTPSLSNPRPITGWTGVNIYVSPTTDAAGGQTFPITFPSEIGTAYSGVLDVTAGTLTVDRLMFSRNTSAMNNNETYPGWKQAGIKQYGAANGSFYGETVNIGNWYSTNVNNDTVFLSTSVYGYNQTQWKALAVDVQILYRLTTPITYQLTPAQILMLAGVNNVWADCGDILNLEYINPTGWKLLNGVKYLLQ